MGPGDEANSQLCGDKSAFSKCAFRDVMWQIIANLVVNLPSPGNLGSMMKEGWYSLGGQRLLKGSGKKEHLLWCFSNLICSAW